MTSSAATADPEIDRVLAFWFDDRYPTTRWFFQSDDLDNQIRTDFGTLVKKARTAELDGWTEKPQGALALVILLDQFCRNLHRRSPESYSADSKALDISIKALAKGFDRELPLTQQSFFYTPFMHNESMIGQIASKALYEGLVSRCGDDVKAKTFAGSSIHFSQKHMDVISRFGRFPARNEALGRKSTPEEIAYLKENPTGF